MHSGKGHLNRVLIYTALLQLLLVCRPWGCSTSPAAGVHVFLNLCNLKLGILLRAPCTWPCLALAQKAVQRGQRVR